MQRSESYIRQDNIGFVSPLLYLQSIIKDFNRATLPILSNTVKPNNIILYIYSKYGVLIILGRNHGSTKILKVYWILDMG